jgi:hypothetical protein
MAVSHTNIIAGPSTTPPGYETFACTVTATADADTVIVIPHGLASAPLLFCLTMLVSQALTAMSNWAVTAVDATNITLTKLTSVGSGNANPQVLLQASVPSSLVL